MHVQKFDASYGKFDRLNFEVGSDFHYSTCMKRLHAHPRHWTHKSQLALCKRSLMNISNTFCQLWLTGILLSIYEG
jgi:hypothetical protein